LLVIGRLSPVWITPQLAVNEGDARHLTAGFSGLAVDATANGVVVARGEVRVVGVKALDPAR
jgi:hypothetical protein